jgi:hypothetical protein
MTRQITATNGWGGSGDPLAPHAATCFSAGPPWSEQFAQMIGGTLVDVCLLWLRSRLLLTKHIQLAVSGATADQSIIFTSPLDFRGQTTAFIEQVVPFPNKVAWNSTDSLFTVSFGSKSYLLIKTIRPDK